MRFRTYVPSYVMRFGTYPHYEPETAGQLSGLVIAALPNRTIFQPWRGLGP